MASTELVIEAEDLKNITIRCRQCRAAVSLSGTKPDFRMWTGTCPSGHPMNGIAVLWDNFERFLASAAAAEGPTVEFRIPQKGGA
jgi:hypothetical protein